LPAADVGLATSPRSSHEARCRLALSREPRGIPSNATQWHLALARQAAMASLAVRSTTIGRTNLEWVLCPRALFLRRLHSFRRRYTVYGHCANAGVRQNPVTLDHAAFFHEIHLAQIPESPVKEWGGFSTVTLTHFVSSKPENAANFREPSKAFFEIDSGVRAKGAVT
jgi:hypothetical protein